MYVPWVLPESEEFENWLQQVGIWQCGNKTRGKEARTCDSLVFRKCKKYVKALMWKHWMQKMELMFWHTNWKSSIHETQDTEQTTFIAYQKFKRYQQKQIVSISDYIYEFERLNDRTNKYGMKMPDVILAYWLLINANILEEIQKLARATMVKLTYANMTVVLIILFLRRIRRLKLKLHIVIIKKIPEKDVFYSNSSKTGYNRGNNKGFYKRG